MRSYIYLIVLFFILLQGLQVHAGILKNNFFSRSKISSPPASDSLLNDSTLKARAVYLELEGDDVEYDHDSNVYITSGMATANIVDQDAHLEADKIIYYGSDQHIEASGDIKIIRQNVVTTGESFKFDVTSNKYLLTKPKTIIQGAIVRARNLGGLSGGEIEYEHGRFRLDNPVRIAQGFGSRIHPRTFYSGRAARASRMQPSWDDVSKIKRYKVTANKIVYDQSKKVDNVTLYGAQVHFSNFSLPVLPKLTVTVSSDPEVRSAPLLLPTAGTLGALGGFALGPVLNLSLTDYHILSLSPFAQLGTEGKNGIGGMVSFHGPSTLAEFSYGSLKDRLIGQFKQRLGRHDEFRAAYNYYLEEGFLGSTLAQLDIGLVDRRKIKCPGTEGVNFRSSSSWVKNNASILPSKYEQFLKDAGEEKDFKNTALKFEEQISLVTKPILKIGNDKFNTSLRFRTRNALRGYSTGNFQGIFTGGPLLENNFGPASFELGYDQGYIKGKSPLFYDQYIQGMQSVSLDGDVKLHEWVSLGGFGTYNIKSEEIVERQLRAKFGPKDFKMLVNWDALRQQTQFGLNFLFGEPVDFEKFVIINSKNKSSGI